MTRTVPTGREQETREIAPTHCGNGHELGPLRVLIAYQPHPGGAGRARTWQCRECGVIKWDEPD